MAFPCSAPAAGASWRVSHDPAPGEVDARPRDVALLGHAVLEVLLRHAFHRHHVAVASQATQEATST